jgi:hypothetical protein
MLRSQGTAKRAKYQWIIGMSVLPLAIGSCAVNPGDADLTSGTSDRWIVDVSGPRTGVIDPCLKDPIIEESIASANLPSTHLSIKLREAAKKGDAVRIADCLGRSLKSGTVSIISPKN